MMPLRPVSILIVSTAAIALAAGICTARPGDPPAPGEHKPHAHMIHVEPPNGGEATFDPAVAPALEVKKAKTGHILVRPVVNGHEAGWFIFDTAAGICCVSTPCVDELGLKPVRDVPADGVGGSEPAKMYIAKTLSLGPITLKDHPLMGTDLSFLEKHLGEKISGVIGYGVLSKCVAEIDLAKPGVALHNPAGYALPRGQWTPADLKDRIPVVRGSLEGHDANFRIDTGAQSGITVHQPTVVKWDLLKGREVTDGKVGGVGGVVPAKKGTIASLVLGGVRLENLSAEFATEAKGNFADPKMDATVGTQVLDRFLIITDYTHDRIGLLPQ